MNTVAECAISRDIEAVSASLELEAVRSAAGRARTFAADSLRVWGQDEPLLETAVLIVSELITNAICHTPQWAGGKRRRGAKPTITLSLVLRPDVLQIEVRDGSSALPVQRAPMDDEDCGRGLMIIAALADSWSSGRDVIGGGKWVRALVPRFVDVPFG